MGVLGALPGRARRRSASPSSSSSYYRGTEPPVAFGNLVINAAFGIPVVWLAATGQLLNPAFFEGVGWPEGAEVPGILTTVIIIGTHRRPGVRLDRRVRQGAAPLSMNSAPETRMLRRRRPRANAAQHPSARQVALRLPRVMRPQISSTMMAPTMAMSQDWIDQKSS